MPLVCVRYRYDDASRSQIKTVELIEERKELSPVQDKIENETLVPVQIAFKETALKEMAKKLGGR